MALKDLERYCKGEGKVSFTRPFLLLHGKVTIIDDYVHVFERYCKGDYTIGLHIYKTLMSHTHLQNLNVSLSKMKGH